MAWTLAASSALAAVTAAAFLHVARSILRRPAAPELRAPLRWFAAYWACAAAFALVAAALHGLAAAGWTPLAVFVLGRHAMTLVGCAGLAALLAHLVFLFTGRRALVPAGAFYAGVALFAIVETTALRPSGVRVGPWHADLSYALAPGPSALAALLLVFVPPMLGALAYAALWARAGDRARRWRVALAAAAILLWHAGQLASRLADDDLALLLARPVLGLVVAGAALLAYAPPAWVERRLAAPPAMGRVRAP